MLLYSALHSHNTVNAGCKHYYQLVTRLAWYSPARYMEQLHKTFYWGQTSGPLVKKVSLNLILLVLPLSNSLHRQYIYKKKSIKYIFHNLQCLYFSFLVCFYPKASPKLRHPEASTPSTHPFPP